MKGLLVTTLLVLSLTHCASATQSYLTDNSPPLNKADGMSQKSALMRCYTSGGSRVVKIYGRYRCY